MPIYEYQCAACDHELEVLQKISDAALTDCPRCAEASLRKKVSAAAFRLKGGGWYETDFKSGDKRNLAGEEKKSGDSGKADGDSKPAAKADAKTAEKSSKPAEKPAPKPSSPAAA